MQPILICGSNSTRIERMIHDFDPESSATRVVSIRENLIRTAAKITDPIKIKRIPACVFHGTKIYIRSTGKRNMILCCHYVEGFGVYLDKIITRCIWAKKRVNIDWQNKTREWLVDNMDRVLDTFFGLR